MPSVRHPRGTRAALVALAGTAGLLPHQVYVLTDEDRIAVALSASTFETFAKESEAGGAAVPRQATLTVSTTALSGYAEVVVTVADCLATSLVRASLRPEIDSENDVEELADTAMAVMAIPEAGQVRFVLTGTGAFVGDFKVLYEVFNP